MEANTRKIKHICRDDLEHMSKHGRFDLASTPHGNILWAILNSTAELWANDTELVESINSMVRLIGTRSPGIKLDSMSARIMVKKSVLGLCPTKPSERKRWTIVRSFTEPLLQELVQTGSGYKEVLGQSDRFTPVAAVSCVGLHKRLNNQNLKHAIPDSEDPQVWGWAHHFVLQWKRDTERMDKQLMSAAVCTSMAAFSLTFDSDSDGGNNQQMAYVRVAACRTRVLVLLMDVLNDTCH